jgi:hypothetical protein
MRTLLVPGLPLLLLAACGGGGPTHWKDQPVETVSATFKGHAYTIELPKGMKTSGHSTYDDDYQYHQDKNGESYAFAPMVGVAWLDKKSTLEDDLKSEKGAVIHKDSTADGWVASYENDSQKKGEDFVIHAQRFVGEAAFTCHARVYAMKRGEDVKELIPLVEKMCLSIKAK